MKITTRAAFAATLVGLALPLHAAELLDKRPYLSPMFAYTFDDSDRKSQEGKGYYLGGGIPLNQYWTVEVGSFYSKFNKNAGLGLDWRELGAKVDGLFFYSRNPAFSPYFGIGAGVQRVEVLGTGLRDTAPLVDAGLGFMKFFDVGSNYNVAFRADARYRWTFLDKIKNAYGIDDLAEPIIKVGLVFPLGFKPGVAVAAATATTAAAKPATGKVIDSDGDGVPDAIDRCPGTPAGVVVDANGCAKSQLPAGTQRQFDDVLFDFDKSELTASGKAILDEAAAAVTSGKSDGLRINVSGHTDWIGSEGYNQALSERRANVAKAYLIKKGVEASRIRTFALGETSPVADNKTEEGRAKNRRDEIRTTSGE